MPGQSMTKSSHTKITHKHMVRHTHNNERNAYVGFDARPIMRCRAQCSTSTLGQMSPPKQAAHVVSLGQCVARRTAVTGT